MKRTALVTLFVLTASASPTPADRIGIYLSGTNLVCAMDLVQYLPTSIYVVHHLSAGTTGSRWKLDLVAGPVVSVGYSTGQLEIAGINPYEGVELGYGSCQAGDVVVYRLDFFSTGVVTDCYQLSVVPYPGETDVIAVDCAGQPAPATGGAFSFSLGPSGSPCYDCTTPVEPSTWGRVKALYR